MDITGFIIDCIFAAAFTFIGYRWGKGEIKIDNLPKRGADGRFQKRSA